MKLPIARSKPSRTFKWSIGILSAISIFVIVLASLPIYQHFSDKRLLKKWNPSLAPIEAQRDIQQGTIKIYLDGTIASFPVGIEQSQRHLIKGLPTAPAGVGCVIRNHELRQSQREYAIRYNQIIIQYLHQHSPSA
jgi:hypothetical protein